MEWMLDIQLGRRNLSPIQRIAVAEKYRPIYEKQAKENLVNAGRKGGLSTQNKPLVNLPNPIKPINTSEKLADIAGVSEKTYRMGAKVLSSDDEELKQRVLSGEIGGSAKKVGRCIKELERIYGVREGRPEKLPKVSEVNQSDIAEMIGISVDTLNNYKKLTKLIPELEDLVDTGILAPTTALAIISLLDNNRNS